MARLASILIPVVTALLSLHQATSAVGTGTSARVYDACALCDCMDRSRVVNCTGLSLHQGLNINYPSKMQVLILNNNNYTYLDEGEFDNYPELVTLKIQSNYIKVVHKNAFQGLLNLKQLYLCSNLIEALPEGVFTPTGNLTYLSLQYNVISIQALGKVLTSVPNIQTLDMTGLPMGFGDSYWLPSGFEVLKHLRFLYLEETVSHLPDNFFTNLENSSLIFLSLARGRLNNVSSDVFLPLPHLQHLELSRTSLSVLTAEVIFEAIAKANLTIEVLNLRHNFIQEGSEDTLQQETFINLQNASVHYLHLEKSWSGFQGHVQRHFFKYVPDIKELFLDTCRLSNIHAQAFKDLHELRLLSLTENYLSCFQGCEFLVSQRFRHLVHLDLSNNVINDLAEAFTFDKDNFPSLEILNLDNNKIQTVHVDIFKDLKHLRRLDLSMNPLTAIESGAFIQLHHLQYLRITDCPLWTSLPNGVFKGLRSLRTLTLNNNQLDNLGRKAFDGLNNLESLSLRNNHLGQGHHINFTHFPLHTTSLTFLDLGENQLEDIPYSILSQQPNLGTLYLDHNRIGHIDPDGARVLSSLVLLDLSYNDILFLDENVFKQDIFPNLRTVSLAGNPLVCDCSIQGVLEWMAEARKAGSINVISPERHQCHGPPSEYSENIFDYSPTYWECHVKLYAVPLLSLVATVFVTCAIVCACKRSRNRDHDDEVHVEEYTEHDLETAEEETGSLTHIHHNNGHVTSSQISSNGNQTNVDAQVSSSVDSSQSSITGLCLPLHNFRRKNKREAEHEGNGHVLLESDDSEPEDTMVEDAVV